jgi:hypothetical protein
MGNSGEQARDRTQSRVIPPVNLTRVNEAAKRSRQTRFTALLHHVDVAALDGSANSTGGWLRCCAGTTPTSACLAIAPALVASVFR